MSFRCTYPMRGAYVRAISTGSPPPKATCPVSRQNFSSCGSARPSSARISSGFSMYAPAGDSEPHLVADIREQNIMGAQPPEQGRGLPHLGLGLDVGGGILQVERH